MDGLGESVGQGISGLIAGAFAAIGAALRGMVAAGERAVPGGLLWAVIFVLLSARRLDPGPTLSDRGTRVRGWSAPR
jgi:hypothetical protein